MELRHRCVRVSLGTTAARQSLVVGASRSGLLIVLATNAHGLRCCVGLRCARAGSRCRIASSSHPLVASARSIAWRSPSTPAASYTMSTQRSLPVHPSDQRLRPRVRCQRDDVLRQFGYGTQPPRLGWHCAYPWTGMCHGEVCGALISGATTLAEAAPIPSNSALSRRPCPAWPCATHAVDAGP